MRVLVCGSRIWATRPPIQKEIDALPGDAVVIHGGARGADSIAAVYARARGLTVEEYRADWDTHGVAAGPIRNQRMIDEGKPDFVLAFRQHEQSRGTNDMIRRAEKAGIPVRVIEYVGG